MSIGSIKNLIVSLLSFIVLFGGCGFMVYSIYTKSKESKRHKKINPRYANKKDTVYFGDSGYVFKKELDTVIVRPDADEPDGNE